MKVTVEILSFEFSIFFLKNSIQKQNNDTEFSGFKDLLGGSNQRVRSRTRRRKYQRMLVMTPK